MYVEEEEKGFNIKNEYSLHSLIKDLYALPGDRFEAKVGRYVVDIVRGNILIEIQTRNFSSIRNKLSDLVKEHPVRLIHPIPVEKWVVYLDPVTGEKLKKRKSPRKGTTLNLFKELIRMPDLVRSPNFSIVLYMIKAEEHRIQGERKGWRGRGFKVKDRHIIGVDKIITLNHVHDYLRFIPDNLDETFTNKTLAQALQTKVQIARWVTYSLKKMGCIREVGKKGNELIFERA